MLGARIYVRRIELHNIRGIDKLDLQFSEDSERFPPCALLIGKNGTGKSSILRSIILGLASDSEATALLAERFGSPFITQGERSGRISLWLEDASLGTLYCVSKEIEKGPGDEEIIEDSTNRQQVSEQRSPFVVAFGAGRSNEGPESSQRGYSIVDSTYMLFDYEGTYVQPELTLRRLRDYVLEDEYPTILSQIKHALGLSDSHKLDLPKGGGVVVSGPQDTTEIPLHAWADGYRVTLNCILDIYAWAMRANGAIDSTGQIHGVLLIDEIEQHLHPTMQRGIFKALKRLFPYLQILATTHSPLVLQGARTHEIISLHRNGSSITSASLGDYSGYSVEDLLTAEELFETPPYSQEIEQYRSEYRELVSKGSITKDERKRLEVLGRELAKLRVLSSLPETDTLKRWEDRLSELIGDQS